MYTLTEVCLDCQNFRRVIIGENATVRHPIGDGVVDEGDKSPTATPGRVIAPDIGIVCELLEREVHAEFGLLTAGDQHLVAMQEVLQFCVAVEDAIAVELQEPTSLRQVLEQQCSSGLGGYWVQWLKALSIFYCVSNNALITLH